MHDYDSGLDMDSFSVTADFAIDGAAAGQNLASRFKALPGGRWELRLATALTARPQGKIIVAIKDKAGNISRIERTFSGPGTLSVKVDCPHDEFQRTFTSQGGDGLVESDHGKPIREIIARSSPFPPCHAALSLRAK